MPWVLPVALTAASIGASLYGSKQANKAAQEAEDRRRKESAIMNLIRAAGGSPVTSMGQPNVIPASVDAEQIAGALNTGAGMYEGIKQRNVQNAQMGLPPDASDADIQAAASRMRQIQAQRTALGKAQLDEATNPLDQAISRMGKMAGVQKDLSMAEAYGRKDATESQLYDALKVSSDAFNKTGSQEAYETMQSILKQISVLKGGGTGGGVAIPVRGGPVIGGFAPTR